jgi:hypothetical protein
MYVTYPSGVRYNNTNISPAMIARAKLAPESRPATEDSEGHWGPPTEGFQLSIRLPKSAFSNGEPITARILLRNISSNACTYVVRLPKDPQHTIFLSSGGKRLKRRDEPKPGAGFRERINALESGSEGINVLPPGTQREFSADLTNVFDLNQPGEYLVSTKRWVTKLGKPDLTEISSGTATFRLTGTFPQPR